MQRNGFGLTDYLVLPWWYCTTAVAQALRQLVTVCPPQVDVLSKRLGESSCFFGTQIFYVFQEIGYLQKLSHRLKTLDLKFFLQHMHVDRRKCSYLSLTNVDAPFDKLATVVDPTKLTVLATVDILPTPVYHTDDRREADRRAVRLWHLRTASNLGSSPHFRNSQSVKHKDTSIKQSGPACNQLAVGWSRV